MPFVRISLPKTLPPETKQTVSVAVHQALMQEFNVPENDYFQVMEELELSQIKYPDNYLGISHSSPMVYIQIVAGSGRTLAQKKQLYHQIAYRIAASTENTRNNVIIVLLENGGIENWSFGNGEMQQPNM